MARATYDLDQSVSALPLPTTGERSPDTWDWILRGVIVVGLGFVLHGAITALAPLFAQAAQTPAGRWIERPSVLWSAMGAVLLAFRTALWFRYRPAPDATMEEAPPLTVVIPAYNEGPMVATSIESVVAARYPAGKLQVIVVDDGSKDDTWEHIQAAAARHPDVVSTIRLARNQGKRAALAAGFRRAVGDIVVTIDSDSAIEPATLLSIAGAMRDPKVGGVAGRVAVYNRKAGIIPQMMHVRFAIAFDMLRAVQSTYRTVYCLPGALSAYRATALREVLDGWLGQTFLGAPCTYGEDRALTNAVLKLGYDTVYQRTAVVHTIVPTSYKQLCGMLLRWDRSFIREEVVFASVVWRRPLVPRLIALVDTTITNLRYPIAYASLALLASMALHDGWVLARVGAAIGAMTLFNMLYFIRTERSWAFLYGIAYAYFWVVALFWIFPYALVTVRAKSWITR